MTSDEPRTLRLEQILTALSDGELESLCLHHFRMVQQDFTDGMGKRQKILRLIDHCDRRGLLDELEQLIDCQPPPPPLPPPPPPCWAKVALAALILIIVPGGIFLVMTLSSRSFATIKHFSVGQNGAAKTVFSGGSYDAKAEEWYHIEIAVDTSFDKTEDGFSCAWRTSPQNTGHIVPDPTDCFKAQYLSPEAGTEWVVVTLKKGGQIFDTRQVQFQVVTGSP